MKYLGKITDNKDLVTKEYVDAYHTPITTKTFTGIIATANSDPKLRSEERRVGKE